MLDNIKPGSTVTVKIVKRPTNIAAAKTLVRVLSKDDKIKARNKHLKKVRASKFSPRMRGGRLYGGQMVKLPAVKAEIGAQGEITCTAAVLNDLRSVSRFVEVTAG